MFESSSKGGSLLGASQEVVHRWLAGYLRQCGLELTPRQLEAAALRVEGTQPGVTKTKVRKAHRRLQTQIA